jgi:hypothetical protein
MIASTQRSFGTRTHSLRLFDASPLAGTPFDGLYDMMKAREACPPQVCIEQLIATLIRQAQLPDIVLHWFHPVAMILALSLVGGFGAYHGLRMRSSRLQITAEGASGSLQKDFSESRNLHPTLMSVLLFFYLFGAQTGLGSMLIMEKPIVDSPHSATALLSFLMLAVQATISAGMGAVPALRPAHTYFGIATLAVIVVHIATGLGLEFSL